MLLQDIRYAFRLLRKSPVFSSVIVLVLALAIGANTAVFSIVHETILKPLPYRDPSRLLAVWDTYLPQFDKVGVSPPELQAWQVQRDLFDETTWYRYVPLDGNLSVPGVEAIAVHADIVASNFFEVLGLSPTLGRDFAITEQPGSVLLSNRLWRTRFGGNPAVLGRSLRFNDTPLTIIGVMPPDAQFPAWADLWLPNGPLLADSLTNPVRHALGFLARLKPGVAETQASQRLIDIAHRLAAEHPKTSTGWGIRVSNLQADLTGNIRPSLLLLIAAASLLLLIACANIASMLLSRASARSKEMAVRAALGASRRRIVRQILTESFVLALLGGAAGFVLAKSALLLLLPTHARLEPVVLFFLIAASLLAGLFFSLAPALYTHRSDPQSVIKSASVTSSGLTTRSLLVVFEFALTLTLVIAAGILAKSFLRLMQADPGFNAQGVLTTRVLAPPSRQPAPLFHRLDDALRALPGVESTATSSALPLAGDRANTSRFNVPGSPLINPDALPAAQVRFVSPSYFQALKIGVRSGRGFDEHDLTQTNVVINETMAKRFWPGRDPVGLKFITSVWGPQPGFSTIVGVVADVKNSALDSEPSLDIYFPALGGQYLVVKTTSDPLALAATIEHSIHTIDPELAISDIRSMGQISSESARTRRWTMGLLLAFAALAMLLALVGIYGVMSWSVTQRTREVGIRMALGAQRRQVLALIMRYGIKLTLAGLAIGIVASFALRNFLATLVYGVSTSDPSLYLSVPALLFAIALLACYLPARKASTVDPLESLRYD